MAMLKRSPHFACHLQNGPKGLFDFAGWEMPTHFSTLEEEIRACRETAILFDGHAMGEVHIRGKNALQAVQWVCANDVSRAKPGQCVYSSMCTENGGIFDDLVVFCISPEHYMLTVAAFNVSKAVPWIEAHTSRFDVSVCDLSAGTTCLEIQGPKSREVLQGIAEFDVSNAGLPYYRFRGGVIAGVDCIVARLGVTGELGYEIFYDPGYAYHMYEFLQRAGEEHGLRLCGNRSIGVMRLEKVYHVYTREIDESTNPYEAGLGRAIKLDKGEFVGREALSRIKEQGVKRVLVGFSGGKGGSIAAPKSPIYHEGTVVGHVTAMAQSPTLNDTIGLGYVSVAAQRIGTALTVGSFPGGIPVKVVQIPFYDPEGKRIRV